MGAAPSCCTAHRVRCWCGGAAGCGWVRTGGAAWRIPLYRVRDSRGGSKGGAGRAVFVILKKGSPNSKAKGGEKRRDSATAIQPQCRSAIIRSSLLFIHLALFSFYHLPHMSCMCMYICLCIYKS